MSWDPPEDPEGLRAYHERNALRAAQRCPRTNPYDLDAMRVMLWLAALDTPTHGVSFTYAELHAQLVALFSPEGFDETTVREALASCEDIRALPNGYYTWL